MDDTPGFGAIEVWAEESADLVGNSALDVGMRWKNVWCIIDTSMFMQPPLMRVALLWAPRVCLAKRPRLTAACTGMAAPVQAARASWSRPEG